MCCFNWLFACFCLHLSQIDKFQLGEYDHGVLYTTAQLTEGRSARNPPKQLPAKKTVLEGSWSLHLRFKLRFVLNSLVVNFLVGREVGLFFSVAILAQAVSVQMHISVLVVSGREVCPFLTFRLGPSVVEGKLVPLYTLELNCLAGS